jgi:hypothetical protein
MWLEERAREACGPPSCAGILPTARCREEQRIGEGQHKEIKKGCEK